MTGLVGGRQVDTTEYKRTKRAHIPCNTFTRLKPYLSNCNGLESVKATVGNPRGSVEKLSPRESVKGGNTALRGSVRAPEGFSEGKPEAAKPRGRSPQGFAAKGLPLSTVSAPSTLSLGDSFSTLPLGL